MNFREWREYGIQRGWIITRDPTREPIRKPIPFERVTGHAPEEIKRRILGYPESSRLE